MAINTLNADFERLIYSTIAETYGDFSPADDLREINGRCLSELKELFWAYSLHKIQNHLEFASPSS